MRGKKFVLFICIQAAPVHAGVICHGQIIKDNLGDNFAEVRCTHDGSGPGNYSCKGNWLLRNAKGADVTLTGNCSVIRGQKNHLCFSENRLGDEKIKDEVSKAKISCNSE